MKFIYIGGSFDGQIIDPAEDYRFRVADPHPDTRSYTHIGYESRAVIDRGIQVVPSLKFEVKAYRDMSVSQYRQRFHELTNSTDPELRAFFNAGIGQSSLPPLDLEEAHPDPDPGVPAGYGSLFSLIE
jgi:hypothetical protein